MEGEEFGLGLRLGGGYLFIRAFFLHFTCDKIPSHTMAYIEYFLLSPFSLHPILLGIYISPS